MAAVGLRASLGCVFRRGCCGVLLRFLGDAANWFRAFRAKQIRELSCWLLHFSLPGLREKGLGAFHDIIRLSAAGCREWMHAAPAAVCKVCGVCLLQALAAAGAHVEAALWRTMQAVLTGQPGRIYWHRGASAAAAAGFAACCLTCCCSGLRCMLPSLLLQRSSLQAAFTSAAAAFVACCLHCCCSGFRCILPPVLLQLFLQHAVSAASARRFIHRHGGDYH